MNPLINLGAIRDLNSRRLFIGQLVSQICDKVASIGMIWIISSEFSPKWVAWFIAVGALPHLLFSAFSGKWVNRLGALRTIVLADLFRGALFVAAGALALKLGPGHVLVLLFLASFVSNIATSLFNPAILTLPLHLAPPGAREQLTAMIDSCFSFGNVLGPLFSVAIYHWVGLPGLLAINGLSYFYAAFLSWRIQESRARETPAGEAPETAQAPSPESTPILSVLKDNPTVTAMLGSFLLMNLFLAPVLVFMPWYVRNIYQGGIGDFAKLEVAMGIGTVVGSSLLSVIQLSGATWKRIMVCLSLAGGSYLAFTLSRSLLVGCLSVASLGLFIALANIVILNFFQTQTEKKDTAVVMGAVNLISSASLPFSMGLLSIATANIPVEPFALACALVMLALASGTRFIPGIKEI